mgnify:CR=1 FL=1
MRLNVDGLLVYFPYDYIYPEQESHPVYTSMRSALDLIWPTNLQRKCLIIFYYNIYLQQESHLVC